MNSLLLNEWRGMKNYSVSAMSGLYWWWQNQEWFWGMKVGRKTFCPLIKGPYSQEVEELLGPIPRSSWSQFTTGWCFLIHFPLLCEIWGGKENRNKILVQRNCQTDLSPDSSWAMVAPSIMWTIWSREIWGRTSQNVPMGGWCLRNGLWIEVVEKSRGRTDVVLSTQRNR